MSESMFANPLASDVPNDGLLRLGYTPREAEFLRLVATHSGYFVRRQYAQFLGKAPGGTVAALLQKAFARNQLTVSTVGRMQVYHLAARSLYAALGLGDNRNRRQRQAPTIQNKLMGLDYVLEHADRRFLTSEREKVDHFVAVRGVALGDLPSQQFVGRNPQQPTRRFFIEKFPLFVATDEKVAAGSGDGFCFVDEGLTTTSRFETFLDHYGVLFRGLPRFDVVYVAATERLFDAARRLFERRLGARVLNATSRRTALTPELEAYFATRSLFDAGQFESFDRAKLIALREQRAVFSGPEVEAQYTGWRASRVAQSEGKATLVAAPPPANNGRFSTYLLRHTYEPFGQGYAF